MEYDELVRRLRHDAEGYDDICDSARAADAITALQARVAELEAGALKEHPTRISGTCVECGTAIDITLEYPPDEWQQRAERAEADLAAARALTTEPVAWQLISQRGLAETWMRMTPPIDHTQDWRPLYALAGKDAPK
jgi:hypothetical protein